MPRRAAPALLCLTVLAACGGAADNQQEPPSTMVEMYDCKLAVTRKSVDTFTGSGTDADPAKAREAAWTAACAELPEAMRVHCRDAGKYTPVETAGTTANTISLTLTPIGSKHAGSAEYGETREAACAAAVLQACQTAGVAGDCVASGAYVKVDEVLGKRQVVRTPPQ